MKIIVCAGGPNPALNKIKASKDDIFIGVDRGALRLIKRGHHLEHAFGDFDSVTQEEFKMIEEKTKKVHRFAAEKDDTDLQIALDFIINHYVDVDPIEIYGAVTSGGRVDHLLSNIWLAHDCRFKKMMDKFYFIETDHQMHYLFPGKHLLINTLLYRYLSLISLTPIRKLEISGAKYELEATDFNQPCSLISNEFLVHQDKVEISFSSGILSVWYVKDDH